MRGQGTGLAARCARFCRPAGPGRSSLCSRPLSHGVRCDVVDDFPVKQASKGLASERCTPTQGECEEEEGGRAERALEGVLRFWVFGVLAGCVEPGTASCWSGWIQEDGRRSLGDTIPDTRATSKVRRGSFAEPFGAHCQTQRERGRKGDTVCGQESCATALNAF